MMGVKTKKEPFENIKFYADPEDIEAFLNRNDYWQEFFQNLKKEKEIINRFKNFNSADYKEYNEGDLFRGANGEYYKIMEKLGQGCWGVVYKVETNDYFGAKWDEFGKKRTLAVKIINPSEIAKKQLKERKLNLGFIAAKEGVGASSDYVVKTEPRRDENGNLFIVMDVYEKNLEDLLTESGGRINSLEDLEQYGFDIISGLKDIYAKTDYVHGDLKPDNILVKENMLFLGDLGTSTVTGSKRSGYKRDHMGCEYTRCPVLFKKGAHPTAKTDIFSFGNILYKMISGEYFLEKEIDSVKEDKNELEKLMLNIHEKSQDEYEKLVDSKINNLETDDNFKSYIKRCLNYKDFGENSFKDTIDAYDAYVKERK